MSKLSEVGEQDGWRCWLCDEPVDREMSVNDTRGPSIDLRTTKAKAKKKDADGQERLAHRGCNTGKGAKDPVVPWPEHLFVVDPAVILTAVERLERKGGREVMARCPTAEDADAAAEWLADRIGRLAPGLGATTEVDEGGGQYLVSLQA
jgi:hypothetical protein